DARDQHPFALAHDLVGACARLQADGYLGAAHPAHDRLAGATARSSAGGAACEGLAETLDGPPAAVVEHHPADDHDDRDHDPAGDVAQFVVNGFFARFLLGRSSQHRDGHASRFELRQHAGLLVGAYWASMWRPSVSDRRTLRRRLLIVASWIRPPFSCASNCATLSCW